MYYRISIFKLKFHELCKLVRTIMHKPPLASETWLRFSKPTSSSVSHNASFFQI